MNPTLLLIDVQRDFLNQVSEPHPQELTFNIAEWLRTFRKRGWPVVHVRTEVTLDPDTRMPHWSKAGREMCLEGSDGSLPPQVCMEESGEVVLTKTFFSGFANDALEQRLEVTGTDLLILAGVHTQSCLLQTALDAYQRGFKVGLAGDAVGTYDPLAGATTERYLAARGIRAYCLDELEGAKPAVKTSQAVCSAVIQGQERYFGGDSWTHFRPTDAQPSWSFVPADAALVHDAVASTSRARLDWWNLGTKARSEVLETFAQTLEEHREPLIDLLVEDVGKPICQARGEVGAAVAMVRAINSRFADDLSTSDARWRRLPVGSVALVTPFNNPLMIPVGKFAAALALGNGVVWKPAPSGSRVALLATRLLRESGVPNGTLNLLLGGTETALSLFSHPGIDAVTLSGGMRAGYTAISVCSSLHRPLQAELGGNNAAIAWGEFDLEKMVTEVTAGAFGFAGQRCPANRRLIVEESRFDSVLEILREKVSGYPVGDPRLEATDCGPMISAAQRSKFLRTLEIAHDCKQFSALQPQEAGYYQAPVLVWGCRPESHIVQEESFGPVLVLQAARDFEQAIEFANGVKQGLAASLFSLEEDLQSRFLSHAQAGILKLNSATHGAHPEVPFGGWKRSGLGPPEHGPGDVEFYTRWQAVYR